MLGGEEMTEGIEEVAYSQIPDKLFFKIGEVAQLTGTKPHVLRYWESEFKMLRPAKGESGQRIYRRKDVELIFSIKQLLYEENFTIAGAKKQLHKKRTPRSETASPKGPIIKKEAPVLEPPEDSSQPNLFENEVKIDVQWLKIELSNILQILK